MPYTPALHTCTLSNTASVCASRQLLCTCTYCVAVCVAVCCSVLQCVVECCGVLHSKAGSLHPQLVGLHIVAVAVHLCVLQRVAVCCSVLQCVAVCDCNLQCAVE